MWGDARTRQLRGWGQRGFAGPWGGQTDAPDKGRKLPLRVCLKGGLDKGSCGLPPLAGAGCLQLLPGHAEVLGSLAARRAVLDLRRQGERGAAG